jgi:hypothetical protein
MKNGHYSSSYDCSKASIKMEWFFYGILKLFYFFIYAKNGLYVKMAFTQ